MRSELPEQAEIEAAFAQVLQAERDAEEAFARCRAECADEIARARRLAESVAARAERRIAMLNRLRSEAVERRIAEIEAEAPGAAVAQDDEAQLKRAAETLARELTGAGK
jgi:hypothetical protein